MKTNKVHYILVMLAIIGLLILPPMITEAKDRQLPYHFQNANIYYQRGKTYIEWYNLEAGRYSIYEYKWVVETNGRLNFEPRIVWSKFIHAGNVRVNFQRKGIRWKVVYSGPN